MLKTRTERVEEINEVIEIIECSFPSYSPLDKLEVYDYFSNHLHNWQALEDLLHVLERLGLTEQQQYEYILRKNA